MIVSSLSPNATQRYAEFEKLIADVSAGVVRATTESIEEELLKALEQIRVFFGGDRCGIIARMDHEEMQITHMAYGPGAVKVPEHEDLRELFPFEYQRFIRGEDAITLSLDDLPVDGADRRTSESLGIYNYINVVVVHDGRPAFMMPVVNVSATQAELDKLVPRLRLLGEILVHASVRIRRVDELKRANEQIQQLKERLEAEGNHLRREIIAENCHGEIVGNSSSLADVLAKVEQVGATDSTVLITGETGTGKELIARAIHETSGRRQRAMIKVNCASLPATLIESELFGRERGAYTGALTRQLGRFEVASGSTLFLDEIGEMPLELQAKLLRVLQEGQFERLGSTQTIKVDVRLVAATNRDLAAEVKAGRFRADLYYRLAVFPINVPPLRQRPDDIEPLFWRFVDEFSQRMGKPIRSISADSLPNLLRYDWPGNVRELRNVIERSVILSRDGVLRLERLPERSADVFMTVVPTLNNAEALHIRKVLGQTAGRIKGKGGAAEILGIKPSTLYSRMHKLGIDPARPRVDIPT